MNMIAEKCLAWLIPFLLGSLVSGGVMALTLMRSVRNGVQCLLRAEIIRQHEKWAHKGFCPIYAKQALVRAYSAYHTLRGNDVATHLYEATMALPEAAPEDA